MSRKLKLGCIGIMNSSSEKALGNADPRLAGLMVHQLSIVQPADAAKVLLMASVAPLAPREQGPHLAQHDLEEVFVAAALGSHGCSGARV
ncbi:hypothetical protein CABS02_14945 [Colletotrichum abscissum]|uniref:Uncharacterized protein n=1 Tax=Colletotrichum abscissum TaxID=1671311 RepID=A0A9Q0AX20_9PEZI|nr:hypothetical protein CABS02_14945 [Colletotrichum abscissum]